MKNETLKSMVDFVEKIKDYVHESHNYDRAIELIFEYSTFLKKPLTLGMFVPCNENGKVLESPIHSDSTNLFLSQKKKYFAAKEKVLFEDAVIIDNSNYLSTKRVLIDLKKEPTFRIYTELKFHDGHVQKTFLPNCKKLTIEDLIKFDLKLSESAIKQIGLNP